MIRRNFLGLSGSGLVLLISGKDVVAKCTCDFFCTKEERLRKYLHYVFSNLEPPRKLGHLYLTNCAEEVNLNDLLVSVAGKRFPRDLSEFRSAIKVRRAQDFKDQNVVILDGWVLSKTEAQLCALTTFI